MNNRQQYAQSDIQRWDFPRQGSITQRVRGSHVDITVRLASGLLWRSLVAAAAICAVGAMGHIIAAFVDGRVQAFLDAVKVR